LSVWWLGLAPALWAPGAADCPEAAAVEAKLRETLGLSSEVRIEERVSVAREGDQLRVTARGKDDRLLGERLLPAEGSCEELAGAVAVVLAAWISDEHPEYVAAAPAPETPPPAPSEPVPPPLPPSAIAPVVAPLPPTRAAETPPPTARRKAGHFDIGAALGASISGDGVVPLGALGGRWMPEGMGLGGSLSASVSGSRSLDLSEGSVRYWRWPLLLGPALRLPLGAAFLDLQGGAALAWLHIEGVDFSGPNRQNALAAGGFASARVALSSGLLRPFAELSGLIWGPTEAFVQRGDAQPTVELARAEISLAFGAAWQAP